MNRVFLYIYYFFRSLWYRGWRKTIGMLLAESRYEKLFRIKTLLIKKSDDKDNYHYQGASYFILLGLLRKLPGHLRDKEFIDFGCGKGRALFCAEYCGFDRLTGVELDGELLEEARRNLATYALKRPESVFSFVHQNALEYDIPPGAQTFYFFNPFSETIMRAVAGRIVDSARRSPREIYIVYVNPKHGHVWTESGFDILFKEGNSRYTEALVYRYAPHGNK